MATVSELFEYCSKKLDKSLVDGDYLCALFIAELVDHIAKIVYENFNKK